MDVQMVIMVLVVLLPMGMAEKKPDLTKSDVFVAKCRSHCVQEGTVDSAEETCLAQEECLRCWASCKAFQSGHYLRDYCKRNKICTSGCRQACFFYMTSGQVPASGSSQSAGDLDNTDTVVVGLDMDVSAGSASAPVYSLVNEQQNAWTTEAGDSSATHLGQDRWTLLLKDMLFRQPLVSATISWESRGQGSQYLVTWELMSGGLRGHLVSTDTSAALPLWPDEDYVVQVFTDTSASEPLQVSTRAPVPAPEEAAPPSRTAPVRLAALLFLLFITVGTVAALAVYSRRRRGVSGADDAALLPEVGSDPVLSSESRSNRRSLLSRSVEKLPPRVLADPRMMPVFVVPCHKR